MFLDKWLPLLTFLSQTAVFPEISKEMTGSCFDDLQTFIMASDERRKAMIESDAEDVRQWKEQKANLEAGVQQDNDDIADSQKKIAEWQKLIDHETIAIAKKQDVSSWKEPDNTQNIPAYTSSFSYRTTEQR